MLLVLFLKKPNIMEKPLINSDLRRKILLFAIAIMLCINGVLKSQVAFNFGQTGGTLSTNNTSGTNPIIFSRYPTAPTNISFFYGLSSGANATLKGSNVGLIRLGDSTEAQASAGNGAAEFCKFGMQRYSSQGTMFSYTKFDAVFAGDSLASSTSNSGVWYFFVGDGGSSDQFMYQNTLGYNVNQCGVALRWTYTTNGGLTLAYYDNTTSGWINITSLTWEQKKKYSIEIYSNVNRTASNSYIRQGSSVTLAPKKMDIWINNIEIASGLNVSQYDNQTLNFKKMDSFCWYGEGSNNAWIFIDNVNCYDNPLTTYAYYTKKPSNGSTLDISLLSNWTDRNDGSAGSQPSSFSNNYTTWFIRNYAGTTGVSYTVSSNIDISAGFDSEYVLGDSGQVAALRIPAGKSCMGDFDIMQRGDLIVETTILPRIRTTNTGSTVEYNNGDVNMGYPLYYNLKILGGTKTLSADYIVDNITTVGNGTNAANLVIPSNFTMTGTADVTNNGKLLLQNTTYPRLGNLASGSTVEYNVAAKSTQTTQAGATYANLIINNSGGVTLGGDNTVSGVLTMTAGNLVLGANTLTLNGTITGSGGTITGSSSSNLTVGGTGALGTLSFTDGGKVLNNFTFNRQTSGTATLGSYLNVAGTLTLTNGIINCNTSADSITLGTNPASPGNLSFAQSGPNYTSWINGRLQRYAATGTGTILFPVGSGMYWEGVKLIYSGNTTTGGSLSAKFTLGDPGNNNTGNIDDGGYTVDRYSSYGYWTVKNNAVTGTYEIDLDAYNFTGVNGDIADTKRQNLRILKRADASSLWTLQGNHSSGNGNASQWTAKRTGLTTFSEFTLGSNSADNTLGNSPLPVTLQSFKSYVNGRNLSLNWITTSEINNTGFEIQRTDNRQQATGNWEKIGFVQGKGTVNTQTYYNFTDSKLNTGKYQYRLKQIDNNGNFEYYILNNFVDISSPEKFDISQNYPNPFNPLTKIDFALPFDSKVKIAVYDISGKELKVLVNDLKTAGYNTVVFDASSLSSGAYLYRIYASSGAKEFSITKKMLLIK
jgi:hypothetical protein